MKKAMFVMIVLVIGLISACGRVRVQHQEIEQDIVLVEQHLNYAWGYQNYGKIIDGAGNSHEFDFSNEERDLSEEEFLLKLIEAREKSEGGKPLFKPEEIKEMYELLYKVDEKKGFDRRMEAVDYGKVTLYGLRYRKDEGLELVKLHAYGDYLEEAQDRSAQALYRIYDKVVKSPEV